MILYELYHGYYGFITTNVIATLKTYSDLFVVIVSVIIIPFLMIIFFDGNLTGLKIKLGKSDIQPQSKIYRSHSPQITLLVRENDDDDDDDKNDENFTHTKKQVFSNDSYYDV